jgi:hypothetical protein
MHQAAYDTKQELELIPIGGLGALSVPINRTGPWGCPPARDNADDEPRDHEGGSAVIHIVLADSENIYRVGIQKIFALEDDIRVIAQADTPPAAQERRMTVAPCC